MSEELTASQLVYRAKQAAWALLWETDGLAPLGFKFVGTTLDDAALKAAAEIISDDTGCQCCVTWQEESTVSAMKAAIQFAVAQKEAELKSQQFKIDHLENEADNMRNALTESTWTGEPAPHIDPEHTS